MAKYTVQPGDTLQSIATAKLGDSSLWQYLASINSIRSPYTVTAGQVISIDEVGVTDSWLKTDRMVIMCVAIAFLIIGYLIYRYYNS